MNGAHVSFSLVGHLFFDEFRFRLHGGDYAYLHIITSFLLLE